MKNSAPERAGAPAEPFDRQHLDVGDGHRLQLAQYGRPDAPAALVLHGGPGSGTQPSVLDWFDLRTQRVVLFDQRGAGASLPQGEIRANDTWRLVADIESLRTALGIDRWMVVGGSWGATLALCYASAHAAQVDALVLRGSFLASARELHWFFQSLSSMVPTGWAALTAGWLPAQKAAVCETLCKALLHGTPTAAAAAAGRWGRYEEAVMQAMSGKLDSAPTNAESPVPARVINKYRLQAHYLSQQCFLREGELLERAAALRMPTILIHGTQDLVCPPENALQLQAVMPHARLRWVSNGGHTPADPGIAAALRQAVADLRETS